MNVELLSEFIGCGSGSEGAAAAVTVGTAPTIAPAIDAGLAPIPADVPHLPAKFQPRDAVQDALIASLISDKASTVSLTATKSRSNKITSQGAGGCGKTTLTVAAVRSQKVRGFFQRIGWATVSQKPAVVEILAKLHVQLTGAKLPGDASGNVDLSFSELQKRAIGQRWCVCLDDVWDSEVERQLNFLDDASSSRLLM